MSTSVLIIGAGWCGLPALEGGIGGRAGLSIHTPAFRCDFHDARGWPSVNRLDRVPAPSVHDNCRTFAATHDLRPCITCNQRVTAIAWD